MKKNYSYLILILFAFTFNSNNSFSQNLVLNPSFENVNLANLRCSWYITNSEFTSAINYWDYPTLGSTDLFHMSLPTTCFSNPLSTNASATGQQLPRTGDAMSNIVTYGSGGCTPYREYLQGELSSPLTIGVTYNIKIHVSLADYSNKGTNNIGIKFTTSRQAINNMCVWQTTPDANYTGTPITDKIGWTELSYQYTPTTANLLYFSIGNFITDSGTTTTNSGSGSQGTIRYFIDDISIEPATNSCGLLVNAGIPQTIDCNLTQTTLNGTANNGTGPYTYSWSPTNGLSNPNIPNPIASPSATTTYTLTVTDSNLCSNNSSVTITVNSSTPPPIVTNSTQAFCSLNNNTLADVQINGTNIIWYDSLTGNNILTNSTQLTSTTYYASQTISGCESLRTPVVVVINNPAIPSFNPVTPICEGEFLSDLPLISLNNISGSWSPQINNLETTTYTFTPNVNECANPSQLTIVVNPKVLPVFNSFDPICFGDSFSLPSISQNNIAGTWTPQINTTETTTYIFSPNANECAISTTMQIEVLEDFDYEIIRYCQNNNFMLEIKPISESFELENSSFSWQFDNSTVSNNYILNVTEYLNTTSAVEVLPLIININVTDENDCSKSKQIIVDNVFCGIQKGISPNNDNDNDFFDLQLLSVSKLTIFNRYGTKVYEKKNYFNEWHGQTNDNKILPDGTYYYLIEFKNGESSKTGWIYINNNH